MRSLRDPHTGLVKLATKQGKKAKPKNVDKVRKRNRLCEICLTCTEKSCKGCSEKKIRKKEKDNDGERTANT